MLYFYLLKRKLIKAVHSGKLKFGKVKITEKSYQGDNRYLSMGLDIEGGGNQLSPTEFQAAHKRRHTNN